MSDEDKIFMAGFFAGVVVATIALGFAARPRRRVQLIVIPGGGPPVSPIEEEVCRED